MNKKENFIFVDENGNPMFGYQCYTEQGANRIWNVCNGVYVDETGETRIYIKEL